jgi:hypothetical protein
MSTSQFHERASLGSPGGTSSETAGAQNFTVTGTLEGAATDTAPASEAKDIWVFVMVEQAANAPEDGQRANRAVARGIAEKKSTDQGDPHEWSAEVMSVDSESFVPGRATGTALTVAYSDTGVGFETYVWTERITLDP